ncbi:MAG: DUF349 domain-containing protein [Rhodoluna sp.]|nr:DUF349 domain-containing protein [Rhodoluna sp.]
MSTIQNEYSRVDENGNFYVLDAGTERLIGSQPAMTLEAALAFYVKKFDDLEASVRLLEQRVKAKADVKSIQKSAQKLVGELESPAAIGDLQSLRDRVSTVSGSLTGLLEEAAAKQAVLSAEALVAREAIVVAAEALAAKDPQKVNYKTGSAKMLELFTAWQGLQKSPAKVSKSKADELWQRFSKARNTFDSNKRQFFSAQDTLVKASKNAKSDLVAKAEALVEKGAEATSAYKDLLAAWKALPKTKTKADDSLWAKFKAAGDAIYAAKSEKMAADDIAFKANLDVKLALLEEAEKIDPTKDLAAAKTTMQSIQSRWEKAGKVPRDSIKKIEDRLKAVESKIKNVEADLWRKSDPATVDRTNSVRTQLEASIAKLEADLEKAKTGGDAKKIADANDALETKKAWLAVVIANS